MNGALTAPRRLPGRRPWLVRHRPAEPLDAAARRAAIARAFPRHIGAVIHQATIEGA